MMQALALLVASLSLVAGKSLESSVEPIVGSLADALRNQFLEDSEEVAARKRLEEEARRLFREKRLGSKRAAQLIRRLANSAPSSEEFVSETTIRRDGHGKHSIRRHTKKCKDGRCEESEESNEPSVNSADSKSSDAVAEQVDKLADAFHDFKDPDPLPMPLGRSRLFGEQGDDSDLGTFGSFWPRFHEPRFEPSEWPRLAQSQSSQEAKASESVSSETVVKDGHAVTRTTRCKNGKCTSSSQEEDLKTPKTTEETEPEAEQSTV